MCIRDRFYIDQKQTVVICNQFNFALFGGGSVHVRALTKCAQDFGRIIFMQHVFVIFPDINMLLADAQKDVYKRQVRSSILRAGEMFLQPVRRAVTSLRGSAKTALVASLRTMRPFSITHSWLHR